MYHFGGGGGMHRRLGDFNLRAPMDTTTDRDIEVPSWRMISLQQRARKNIQCLHHQRKMRAECGVRGDEEGGGLRS